MESSCDDAQGDGDRYNLNILDDDFDASGHCLVLGVSGPIDAGVMSIKSCHMIRRTECSRGPEDSGFGNTWCQFNSDRLECIFGPSGCSNSLVAGMARALCAQGEKNLFMQFVRRTATVPDESIRETFALFQPTGYAQNDRGGIMEIPGVNFSHDRDFSELMVRFIEIIRSNKCEVAPLDTTKK